MGKEVWKFWKETYNCRWGHNRWEVSDQGRVKKNSVLYECKLNNGGYKGFGGKLLLHRVIAELFVPNPENKPCVDHINSNPLDNRACNLRWCTPKENSNNPITRERMSKNHTKLQSEQSNRKRSESLKGRKLGPQSEESKKKNSEAHLNTHRVYHDDGTWHMEK